MELVGPPFGAISGWGIDGDREEFEVIGGDRDSLFKLAIPWNMSDDPDLGLREIGGLQLLDEFGDENDLAFEFSPNNKDEAIEGCLSWSCAFIWPFVALTNEDISTETISNLGYWSVSSYK